MMNVKNQPPILVPGLCRNEVEKLSKAALMDIVWSFATRCSGNEGDPRFAMDEFRRERDVIVALRKAESK